MIAGDGTTVWWTVQWHQVMYYVDKWQKYFEPLLCFVLVMQTALCPTSPQSILETAVSHAYPEQHIDNAALYCLSVHPHSLWEGGKTQCCAPKNTHVTHEEQNLVPSHTAKYKFKWIQKWEKCTCYWTILRKYAIKEMDYAILNILKCAARKKTLGYNIHSLEAPTPCVFLNVSSRRHSFL
jgi:hypothetical protein